MSSTKPINVGKSNRLESLYAGYNGKTTGKNRLTKREKSLGNFDDNSLNHSSKVLNLDPTKRYKG